MQVLRPTSSATVSPAAPAPDRSRTVRHATRSRVGVVLVAALVLGACHDDGDERPPVPRDGGTLRVVIGGALAHLDPQRVYAVTEANVSRLLTRTLTTFRSVPGSAASEVVGDLATDAGRPSERNQVWDFTLKDGVRWEDGSPVTCADVKYGIQRSFSPQFADGARYPSQYLRPNPQPYTGPFAAGADGAGLRSIECLTPQSIRFHLKQPVGDFGYAVALSVFAPVPAAKDTKEAYDHRPFSNGPYRIEWSTAQELVLARNPFWQRRTDAVRGAHPDRIVITWRNDTTVVTAKLVESDGAWADTIAIDRDAAPNFVQQIINDPVLSRRAVVGSTGGVRYFALNTRTLPELSCRQALTYALNKRRLRAALGGFVVGEFATTMLAPQLKSHRAFDLYGSIANPDGDPEHARRLLQQAAAAGRPCPARIRLAYPDSSDVARAISTVVESYQHIGIEVVRRPYPSQSYYSTGIGNPANGNDMMWAGWVPDWPNGSAVIPPQFDGRHLPKDGSAGNTDYANFNDPRINALIDEALAESDLERQYRLWGALDEAIQAQAVSIPVFYIKALRMAGAHVRNGFIHPQFGQPDLCALYLA
ncbi:ABC transporter substrate-binding protein [Dactylosporangium sucinum]|uniref:ABC transporter substrate-binding protein n=1 Tax=Dactylosporangium sucinum TaxID=1424081 RepID=A0A917T0N0_9ACTN|nr:ABC transporter substrate-binding protein [Dactylosporangium sucinum]GGM04710.1 ABC transporter substrate-binding protein [Dactylosporangium sucinum]